MGREVKTSINIKSAELKLRQFLQALVTINQYTNFYHHYHWAEANISIMVLSIKAIVVIVNIIVSVLVAFSSMARTLVEQNNNF